MKVVHTNLEEVQAIATSLSKDLETSIDLVKSKSSIADLRSGFEQAEGYVLSCKLSSETVKLRQQLIEQVCNETCSHLNLTNGVLFPDYSNSEERINIWSSRWRNIRWDLTTKDKDKLSERRNLKSSELKFKIDTYGSQNLREWKFDNIFVPKDGYRSRILPDVMNLEADDDVRVLAKILYDKQVVREEVSKYLLSASMAGTLYNQFIETKAAFGRAVVNADTFSRTKLLKLISGQYNFVSNEQGRRELEAIIATLFLAETACLGMISRGILKFKHYREELNAVRDNYRLGLECLQLAHIIKDYIYKCKNYKYSDLLSRGRRTDRLSDIFTLLYEELRDGLTFKIRHTLKIDQAIAIVESLIILKVLGVEGILTSIAPDLLDDPVIEKLSRNYSIVAPLLKDKAKMGIAYTMRPDRSVIVNAIKVYGSVLEDNLFFKSLTLAEFLDNYQLKTFYTETEKRKVGLLVYSGTKLLDKSLHVLARVSANVERSYAYVDASSYNQYAQFGNSEIQAASLLNGALANRASSILERIVLRGVLTNVSDEELELVALALNDGKQKLFLEGELLKSEILNLHADLGPIIKSDIPKVHKYYEYHTEDKLLDDMFNRAVIEFKRTTDAAEYLLVEAQDREQRSDFEVHGMDLRITSTKTQHMIPDAWFGFDIDTEFHFELEEVLERNYKSSLKRLMYDNARYGAKMTFDFVQYALRSRAMEDFLFFELLGRSYVKVKLDYQAKDENTRREIMNRQHENFKNSCFESIGEMIKQSKFIKYTIVDIREIVFETAQLEHGEADVRMLPMLLNERLNTIKLNALLISNELFNVQDGGVLSVMLECAAKCEYYTEESIDGEV